MLLFVPVHVVYVLSTAVDRLYCLLGVAKNSMAMLTEKASKRASALLVTCVCAESQVVLQHSKLRLLFTVHSLYSVYYCTALHCTALTVTVHIPSTMLLLRGVGCRLGSSHRRLRGNRQQRSARNRHIETRSCTKSGSCSIEGRGD